MQAGKFVSASEILKETNNKLYPCYGANGLRGFTYSYNYEGEYSLIGRQGALCGNVTRVYDKFYATEHAVVVTPKEEVHSTWLFYLLNYLNLNQYATGMAQPGLSVQNLLEVESIITDSIDEQEKIASLLLLIDNRIQTQRKIIEQLETLMRANREKLFSQKFKFKDELGNDFPKWESVALKDVGDIITGKTPSTKDENLWGGEIQFVTPTDIVDNKYQYFTERSLKGNDKLNILPEKSIMFTCIASIGKMSLSSKPCVTNQQINSVIPNSNFDNEFVFYALANISDYIKSTQSSSTMPIINKTEFSKFKICKPILKEQTKIANFLSSIQEKLEIEKQILEKLELHKKFLLANLFV